MRIGAGGRRASYGTYEARRRGTRWSRIWDHVHISVFAQSTGYSCVVRHSLIFEGRWESARATIPSRGKAAIVHVWALWGGVGERGGSDGSVCARWERPTVSAVAASARPLACTCMDRRAHTRASYMGPKARVHMYWHVGPGDSLCTKRPVRNTPPSLFVQAWRRLAADWQPKAETQKRDARQAIARR